VFKSDGGSEEFVGRRGRELTVGMIGESGFCAGNVRTMELWIARGEEEEMTNGTRAEHTLA